MWHLHYDPYQGHVASKPIGLLSVSRCHTKSLTVVMNRFFPLLPAALPELGAIGQDKGSDTESLATASQKAKAKVSPPK